VVFCCAKEETSVFRHFTISAFTMIVISLASLLLASLASAADVPTYEEAPANYQFKWDVLDGYTGNEFGQEEARSGYNTDGEYRVLLPDGRRQIVSYKVADGYSGYIADVRYEGEAKYAPEHAYEPAPKPAYKPAPAPYKAPAPKPVYQPRPAPSYHRPAYVAPEPAYKPSPAPAYKPAPAPAYKAPEPTYKPAPKPVYKPVPEPAYKPEPVYTTPKPAYRPRPTYAPLVAAASTLAPQYYKSPDGSAPTYNAAKPVKRRMTLRHRNALPVATAKSDGFFYGDAKRVRPTNSKRARAY